MLNRRFVSSQIPFVKSDTRDQMPYMINPKASGLSLHIMLEFRTMSSGSKIKNSGVINTGER